MARANSSAKPLVFISYAACEKQIAAALKEALQPAFLNTVDFFVASDRESISLGATWPTDILDALKRMRLMILIASPVSLNRPWVNFEAGAAMVREIPLIPLCHSSVTPDQLPVPVGLKQGVAFSDSALREIVQKIAGITEISEPVIDFANVLQLVDKAEVSSPFVASDEESSSSSGPELQAAREPLPAWLAGPWELEFDAGDRNRAGTEFIVIKIDGDFQIFNIMDSVFRTRFRMSLDSFNEQTGRARIIRTVSGSGEILHVELLKISEDRRSMDGEAEHDGHRLFYSRREIPLQ